MAKPVEFEETNVVFGEGQEDYQPLPAFRDHKGVVLTCWQLSEQELNEIKRTGKIWLSQMTFNQALQPVLISGLKHEMIVENKDIENG